MNNLVRFTVLALMLNMSTAMFAVDKLYIVGDAVFTWRADEALLMYSEGSDVFSFTGYFEADKEFKFLKQPAWGDDYCNGAGSTGYLSTSGTLTANDSGDSRFKMQTAGYYKITCNLTNLTITAEAKTSNDEQPYLYQALYAVGSATIANWTCGNAQRIENQGGRLYSGDIYLKTGGTFKLTTAPSETFNSDSWWYFRDGSDAGKISSDATNDRQWSVSETGLYTVTVDLDAKTISIQKTDYKLYVIGSAVFSGWDSSKAPMMNVESANVFTYTGWFAADQEFKFSTQRFLTNRGLQFHNGAASTGYITGGTGTLMPNVEVIGDYKFKLAEAGNYKITCNLNTMIVTAEKIAYQDTHIQYSALYMVGMATPDKENSSVFPSLAVKLHSNGDNTYSAKNIALTTGVFKIITANDLGWNTKNYFRDAGDAGKISEDATGDRKWSISEEGNYNITVDMANMTINIAIIDRAALIIRPGIKETKTNYLTGYYGDIIFESTDSQFDLEGGSLNVKGVVKLVRTFAKDKWYAIGFPFAIASVRCDVDEFDDRDLETYKPAGVGQDKGDYWLQTYDGVLNKFEDYTSGSKTIVAGGYVLQIPDDFDGGTFTFTSEAAVTLSNSGFENIAVGEYKLTCNPSFTTKTITNADPDYFYAFENRGVNTNNFGLLAASENYDLKPFASVVIAKATGGPSRSSMNLETLTSLPELNLQGEKVISTEYYNLQGVKIAQPNKGDIYLVKKIFESGKTNVVKQIK